MDGGLINWQEIGLELRRHGWGASRVAEHMNLPRSTVRKWFEDSAEPGYHSGLQLIRLHNRVVIFRRVESVQAWRTANCL